MAKSAMLHWFSGANFLPQDMAWAPKLGSKAGGGFFIPVKRTWQ